MVAIGPPPGDMQRKVYLGQAAVTSIAILADGERRGAFVGQNLVQPEFKLAADAVKVGIGIAVLGEGQGPAPTGIPASRVRPTAQVTSQ